jgi:hypothetical protein
MFSQTTARLWAMAILESLFPTQVSVVQSLRTQLPVTKRLLRKMPNLRINLRITPSVDSSQSKRPTKRLIKMKKKTR